MGTRVLVLGAVAATAIALTGCGSSGSAGSSAPSLQPSGGAAPAATGSSAPASSSAPATSSAPASASAASHTTPVTIKNYLFHPATLTVRAGTTVDWTNTDSSTHTVTATSPAKAFDSGSLPTGKSYHFTFTKAGTYHYICTIHPFMKGTVVVR